MGDEMSLRELTQGAEEKPRVMKMGKRNIKAQVSSVETSASEIKFGGLEAFRDDLLLPLINLKVRCKVLRWNKNIVITLFYVAMK